MSISKILFVYNAEAGFLNGMMDSLHKTVSPETYECALCSITHGMFSMDKTWRAYLKSLPHESTFYHRKDFGEAFPNAYFELPVILLQRGEKFVELVSAKQMKEASDVNSLSKALDSALANSRQ
jgi:hypothetical protein